MSDNQEKSHVKVYVRHRPFTRNEIDFKYPSIIKSMNEKKMVVDSGSIEKSYQFDGVFDDVATQEEIYDTVVHPLIEYIVSGYNCTVFAYGQTGTGKTHTMIGAEVVGAPVDITKDHSVGIIPRAALHLFDYLNKLGTNIEYTVKVSFLEIYNEDVRDLLITESPSLRIYDDPENRGSIYVNGLREVTVCNIFEVFNWLHIGTKERQTASTNLNRQSSRSHSLFTLVVHTREITAEGEELLKTGKLHMIDLAGSENIGRSGATDMRAREAGTINKSLLTLGKVIKALVQKTQHIPYRDSKLTRILQDSLGGNSKTCMIATFSPGVNNWDETISTLDYAFETRKVANCPKANVNRNQIHIIKDVKEQIINLRRELDAARKGEGFYMTPDAYNSMESSMNTNDQKILSLVKEIRNLEDYKQTIETQYRNLDHSFEKTKQYLEEARRELEENTLKDKEDQFIMHYMNGREMELIATANDLIDVCERSTEREEVYHSKYQAQSKSAAENVRIVKELYSSSVAELETLQDNSEEYMHNQERRFQLLKEKFRSLKANHVNSVEDLGALAAEMKIKSPEMAFRYETVLEHNDYNDADTMQKISLDFLKKLYIQLEHVRERISKHDGNLKALSKTCASTLQTAMYSERAHTQNVETCYNNVKAGLNEFTELRKRRECLEEELKSVFLSKFPVVQAMNDKLIAIDQDIKEQIDQLTVDTDKYEEEAVFETLNEQLTSLKNRHISSLGKEAVLIENVLEANAKVEANYKQKVEEAKMAANTQLLSDFDTLGNNVKQFNKNLKNSFQSWLERVQATKQLMFDSLQEPVTDIKQTFKAINEITKTHYDDVKKFTQQAAENVARVSNGAVQQAHVGDTPVKEAFAFPKTIEKSLTDENLRKQFKMNNE